jgi:hypothetical protein
MEVHHHPNTEKKKFKEYFLEFLMIFLAVSLGFFAESLREHMADKRKEKQIIVALVNDMKKDTANLDNIINLYMPQHSPWVDTLETYINSLPLKGNEPKITKALINATNWNLYSPPEVALNILKNSGTFNLIKNEKVKTEIIEYNGLINNYITYSQYMLTIEHSIDTATTAVITRGALRILIEKVYLRTNAEFGSIGDRDIPATGLLKTYNKSVFTDYIKKLDVMDYLLNDLLGLYKKILKEEITLLEVLKKEYHLK